MFRLRGRLGVKCQAENRRDRLKLLAFRRPADDKILKKPSKSALLLLTR